jgi:hypothetical protein
MGNEVTKYARVCSVTNKGMNTGYVFGDGVFYCKTAEQAVAEIRGDLEKSIFDGGVLFEDDDGTDFDDTKALELPDSELMELSYKNDYHYYTEWGEDSEDFEDEYYLEDGTLMSVCSKCSEAYDDTKDNTLCPNCLTSL